MQHVERGLRAGLRAVILAWRYGFAALFGPACRYAPSCSEYALEAIERHGPKRGSWLALRRILRCHPWGGAGFDPVPRA
ncbi:MAG: membrane protein insertion efficiency factor YidD [Alphaproteobacteria bacterium]|nr:membrane protein insertion efficiency factor YidD [Alphaproteobacteria bacterium]